MAARTALRPPSIVIDVVKVARLELETLYLGLCGWFLRPRRADRDTTFTHHVGPGSSAIATALVLLLVVEGAVVHVLLQHVGYITAKWIASAIHVYGALWVLGDAQALRIQRTTVDGPDGPWISVRVGLRGRGRFRSAAVSECSIGSWLEAGPGELLISAFGPANIKLTFRQPVEFSTRYRVSRWANTLLLRIDEPADFARAVRASVALHSTHSPSRQEQVSEA